MELVSGERVEYESGVSGEREVSGVCEWGERGEWRESGVCRVGREWSGEER